MALDSSPALPPQPNGADAAAPTDTYASDLHQLLKATYKHVEDHFVSQGRPDTYMGGGEGIRLLRDEQVIFDPALTEKHLNEDFEALRDLLGDMKKSAIKEAKFFLLFGLFLIGIASLIVFLTPLRNGSANSIVYYLIWMWPCFAISESVWKVNIWCYIWQKEGVINNLQKKLWEGRLKPRDKFKVQGFLWNFIGINIRRFA